jgi:hypothetical protein
MFRSFLETENQNNQSTSGQLKRRLSYNYKEVSFRNIIILIWVGTTVVTGEWRKLHSEELHNLYSSADIIRQVKSRRMRWAGHVARMVEERNVYKVLVGKPEGKRPLGRPRRRWEDGIRMDLRRLAWGVWIGFDCIRTGTGGGLL